MREVHLLTMTTVLFATLAVVTATVVPARSAEAPARPPDGIYTYDILQNTTKIGQSTITVRTINGSVAITESATLGPVKAQISATYEASTLRELHYNLDANVNGSSKQATVTPVEDGVNVAAGTQSVDIAAVRNAPLVVIGDNFTNSAFMLPSILQITKPAAFTLAVLAGGKAIKTTITESPGLVVANVDGLELKYAFDPATMILQRLDVPAQMVEYVLVPGRKSK